MIAREGYPLIAGAGVLAAVLVLVGIWLTPPWDWLLMTVGVGVLGFTLLFFRDPVRTPPSDASNGDLILAPADGRVVLIDEVDEPLYLKERSRQVSIFLSPLDVHVNRIPVSGVIEYDNYVPGDYLVAWHPKASEKNERSQLGVRHASGRRFLFKQIAGAVARRIVYHIEVGDEVKVGDRFGIVKFGSRMDVVMPHDVELEVEVGDRVRAGESILARMPAVMTNGADVLTAAAKDDPTP